MYHLFYPGQEGTHGPYTKEQLQGFIAAGQIHESALVSENGGEWIPLASCTSLQEVDAPVTPMAPIASAPSKGKGKLIAIIAVVLLLGAGAAYFFLMKGGSEAVAPSTTSTTTTSSSTAASKTSAKKAKPTPRVSKKKAGKGPSFDVGMPVHQKKIIAGAKKGFLFNRCNINSGHPCELGEILFFNGDDYIPAGRASLFGSGREYSQGKSQPTFYPLFDRDPETLAQFPNGKKEYNFYNRVDTALPIEATHMIIVAPKGKALFGKILLENGEDGPKFELDLGSLRSKGNCSLYRIDIPSGKVTADVSWPTGIKPYKPVQLESLVRGRPIRLNSTQDLEALKPTASKCRWAVEDNRAFLDIKPGDREGSGQLTLPDTLAPGQTLGITLNQEYPMWLSVCELAISLGDSKFTLLDRLEFEMPNGEKYVSASYDGHGIARYHLLLSRGTGSKANTISWALVGDGLNRYAQTTLNPADASNKRLPIKLNLSRKWGWKWFNHTDMGDWKIRIDQVFFEKIIIGTLNSKPSGLEKANLFKEPNKSTPDKHWYKGYAKSATDLPTWSPNPALGSEKRLTKEEADKICQVLPNMPLPQSNKGCNIYWSQVGHANKFYQLLNASDDKRFLDQLVRWSESVLEYRNDGPHAQVPVIVPGLKKGEVLKGWSQLVNPTCIDGQLSYNSDAWDYACWVVFMYYTEYVSAHPELWDQPVGAGKAFKNMTHFELMKKLVDASFESIAVAQDYFTAADGVTIPRPWNRYTTMIEAFHHLRVTYDNLEANGAKINAERHQLATDFVEAFLKDFFDPTHFEKYSIEHNGKTIQAATFRYNKSSSYAEDIQHGSAESNTLKLLYNSGLYPELFTKEDYEAFCNTVKYVVITGFEGGKVQYLATFGNPPNKKHGGVVRFPSEYVEFCKGDSAIYGPLKKQFMPDPKDFSSYIKAVLWRLNHN